MTKYDSGSDEEEREEEEESKKKKKSSEVKANGKKIETKKDFFGNFGIRLTPRAGGGFFDFKK